METAEKEQIHRALTRLHTWNEANPNEPLGVKMNFEAPIIVKDVPVLLHDTMDRLELWSGELPVVDLKTDRRPPTRAEVTERT